MKRCISCDEEIEVIDGYEYTVMGLICEELYVCKNPYCKDFNKKNFLCIGDVNNKDG